MRTKHVGVDNNKTLQFRLSVWDNFELRRNDMFGVSASNNGENELNNKADERQLYNISDYRNLVNK